MRLPWDKSPETSGSLNQPPRLPQRWVIILTLASAAAVTLSITVNLGVGATVGVLSVGLLHEIMD
jgi:hypothetical protein